MAHPPRRDDPAGAAVAADEGGCGDASRWPTGGRCWGCRAGCDGWRSTIHRLRSAAPIRRRTVVGRASRRCRRGSSAGGGTPTSSPRRPAAAQGCTTRSTPRCPAAALRSTFVYRHRQLADDLAAHRDGRRRGRAADGRRGHRRIRSGRLRAVGVPEHGWASRHSARAPTGARRGRAAMESGPPGTRSAVRRRRGRAPGGRVDRRTLHRWPQGRDPRQPDRADAQARRRPPHWPTTGPRSSSAPRRSAIYGFDRGDALLCEESVRGDGFLADVVADWEAATAPAAEAGLRVVTVRTGIVQSAARRHAAG